MSAKQQIDLFQIFERKKRRDNHIMPFLNHKKTALRAKNHCAIADDRGYSIQNARKICC
jgi:hypothetical protein